MLIHRGRAGEALLIGDNIEIRIISVRSKVVLGIIAPREVPVTARAVGEVAMENTVAATHAGDLNRILSGASRQDPPVVMAFEPLRRTKPKPGR